MKLKFKKDVTGIYNHTFSKDEMIDYHPWNHSFKGLSEPERTYKGIFVFCYGMGEFNVFGPDEVEVLNE